MDSHGELHPNWRALATVHLSLKRFVPEGTGDKKTGTISGCRQMYKIHNITGEDAMKYYETITKDEKQTEFVRESGPKRLEKPLCAFKAEVKRPFNQKVYFRCAIENNVQSLEKFHYTVDELNSCDDFGWTALMMAACEGAEDAVRMLLRLGVKKELQEKCGKTALDLARSKGHEKIVETLENFGNVTNDGNELRQESLTESLVAEPFYCEICKREFKDSDYKKHLTSTVHQFNARSYNSTNKLQKFNIPPRNRGLQLMVKQGWDRESGLGPTSSGRLYPVKTVIRKERTGLGIEQSPARVTHFAAFDLSATKSTRMDFYKKKNRNRNDIKREKQRDWKRERRLRSELS